MKINKIDLKALHNDSHFQFNCEARDLAFKLKTGFQLDVQTEAAIENYRSMILREDEALKKVVKSALTEKINEADRARDKVFSSLAEFNRATCNHFKPSLSEPAKRLRVVFDTFGNVAKKPLNEETSLIHNLCQELKSAKYKDDCKSSGISDWVDELKNRNDDYIDLVKQRYNEAAQKSQIVMKDARRGVDTAYLTVVERINAFVVLQDSTPYESFVNTLNIVIARYTVKKHHRRGNHEGEYEE